MQIDKLALYLLLWTTKLMQFAVNAVERSATPNADLDAKYKKISQTLKTLDKIRNDKVQNITKRMERSTDAPMAFVNHQSMITDEGSGSPPFSDDDDYNNAASGMNPFDDEESGDGPDTSSYSAGDADIGLEDLSTISARGAGAPMFIVTTTTQSTKISKETTPKTSLSTSTTTKTTRTTTTTSTSKSTTQLTTLRPVPLNTKIMTVSHVESPEYDPRKKSNSGATTIFVHWSCILKNVFIVICSIRWLWRL